MNPATFKSSKQADCYHDDTVAKGKEMKVLHALFTVAITALLAAGCATVPEPLAGEYPATTPDLADDSTAPSIPRSHHGASGRRLRDSPRPAGGRMPRHNPRPGR